MLILSGRLAVTAADAEAVKQGFELMEKEMRAQLLAREAWLSVARGFRHAGLEAEATRAEDYATSLSP